MELTPEQLEHIRQWASVFIEPEKIARILQVDVKKFCELATLPGPIQEAIMDGEALGEANIMQGLARSAFNGSQPAIERMLKILKERNSAKTL